MLRFFFITIFGPHGFAFVKNVAVRTKSDVAVVFYINILPVHYRRCSNCVAAADKLVDTPFARNFIMHGRSEPKN